jgi:hypothetical protein
MLVEVLVAFGIASICVVIHITILITLVERLVLRSETISRRLGFRHFTPLLLSLFSVITLLHFIEACIWGAFYAWYGLFPDWETSIYFSLSSYTTIGYGDTVLPRNWRLLGTIEGISGVLLCGLSTAFLFAIINAFFRMRVEQVSGESEKQSAR